MIENRSLKRTQSIQDKKDRKRRQQRLIPVSGNEKASAAAGKRKWGSSPTGQGERWRAPSRGRATKRNSVPEEAHLARVLEIVYVSRTLALHPALEGHAVTSCHHYYGHWAGQGGSPKPLAEEDGGSTRLRRLWGAENEPRNLHLLWERSFWNRNSTMRAELSQWQEGWTNKESAWQWKGKTGVFYYVVYTGCSLRHPVLRSSMEKLGPPLPGFVCSNIHERKAILLLHQGSSILVALTILPSPLGPSISQSKTSLTVWLNATLSA